MDIYRFRLPGMERTYSREPRNKGFLVVLQRERKSEADIQERAEELKELTRSATVRIVGSLQAYIPHPSPSHFLREGKLNEVREQAIQAGANVLILSVDLSPTQASNIEAFTKIPVVDRTGLILEIFGRRAKSKEGKMQVELAQLQYAMPRLRGLGTVMSRLGGGIGGRGPGEQELERDRRKVQKRIQQVKSELKEVRKHRELIRAGRKKRRLAIAALVGYTNAGKSTLLNALTGSQVEVEDKMFATLDPTARMESINGRKDILFVDTVGFLRDLPHSLIESFQATLEEVTEADILIHVLDASSPHVQEFKQAVEKVLEEIHAAKKPCLLALNKADLLSEEQKKHIQEIWSEGILISAKESWGLNHLLHKLDLFTLKAVN